MNAKTSGNEECRIVVTRIMLERTLAVDIFSFYCKKCPRIREKPIEENVECAINCQGIRLAKTWRVQFLM